MNKRRFWILVVLFFFLLVLNRFLGFYASYGESMEPTFSTHFGIYSKFIYWFRDPKFNDVVLINDGDEILLKRIVGTPGDLISITNGILSINNITFDSWGKVDQDRRYIVPIELGENFYWYMGDNALFSTYGIIHRDQILGKVLRWDLK